MVLKSPELHELQLNRKYTYESLSFIYSPLLGAGVSLKFACKITLWSIVLAVLSNLIIQTRGYLGDDLKKVPSPIRPFGFYA